MSAITSRCTNRQPALHRPEPTGEGFALRRNNLVSGMLCHQEIRHRRASTRHLSDVAVRLSGFLP